MASFFRLHATTTPVPLSTSPLMTDIPATTISQNEIITSTVFDERLNSNWSIQTSTGMEADQANTTHAHIGNVSIAMTPQKDFSKLSFIVNQTATVEYPRNQVIGISFWLNSGNDYVKSSDLAVSVIGSNSTPYWVANDNSVSTDNKISFSETRLYYLGLNRSIPPETWVHLIVYLDNLIYDPPYNYLTGFYIKNDAGFHHTVYIDDINVLMVSNNTQPTNTVTPIVTRSYLPTVTPEPTKAEGFPPKLVVSPMGSPSDVHGPLK